MYGSNSGMYGSGWNAATYGGGFVKYGPGDGGALQRSGDWIVEIKDRVAQPSGDNNGNEGMKRAMEFAFSSTYKNLVVHWQRSFGKRFYKFGYSSSSDFSNRVNLIASSSDGYVDPETGYFFEGVPVWNVTWGDLEYGAAFTLPGFGIFVSLDAWKLDRVGLNDLLKHEFGHILQSREWGENFFYSMVAGESFESAIRYAKINEHKYTWTERSANYFSRKYFGYEGWNYNKNPISLPSMNLQNKFTRPPVIKGLLPIWWDQEGF